jgi:hypothetical protein
MRIAMLSPIAWRTPPREYGPWEQVVATLTEGLVTRGVEVTLFATGDSLTAATLSSVVSTGYEEDRQVDAKVAECLHISEVFERADEFDLIHNHFDFLPLAWSRLTQTPVLTTIHGFSSQGILPVYRKYDNNAYYVSISDADRSPAALHQREQRTTGTTSQIHRYWSAITERRFDRNCGGLHQFSIQLQQGTAGVEGVVGRSDIGLRDVIPGTPRDSGRQLPGGPVLFRIHRAVRAITRWKCNCTSRSQTRRTPSTKQPGSFCCCPI